MSIQNIVNYIGLFQMIAEAICRFLEELDLKQQEDKDE